jgi:hypothetical protein
VDDDGVCGDVDNCPSVANGNQNDMDGDGCGSTCDLIRLDLRAPGRPQVTECQAAATRM